MTGGCRTGGCHTGGCHTGGCQCGALRYRVAALGRATLCHCRMCQKAFGGLFGPLVEVEGLEWTRGAPARFDSSNRNWRCFCAGCGTPLTYEHAGGAEVAIGSLDHPDAAPPVAQVNIESRRACFGALSTLPPATDAARAANEDWNAGVRSRQHPDHDTARWPPQEP